MKVKIGALTEEIKRMSNEVYKTDGDEVNWTERISVELNSTNMSAKEVNEQIERNYVDRLIYIGEDGEEEIFTGYIFESTRKSYDSTGKQLTIEFRKPHETGELRTRANA